MKYFELSISTDLGITGTIPQVRFAEIPGNDQACDDVVTYVRHPDRDSVFKGRKQPGAIFTDLMSCAGLSPGKGLLVSNKTRDLAEKFDCTGCRSFLFNIHDPETGKIAAYNFFHIIHCRELSDSIDYEKSRFLVANDLQPEAVKITDWQDWWNQNLAQVNDSGGIINTTALFLKNRQQLPGIVRMPFSAVIFVSEELKEKITEQNLSGFSFNSSNFEIFQI